MKDLLNRVITQIDKLDDKLESVDKTLIKQEENLREHMRRTEILEEQHTRLESELQPIEKHVNQVRGVFKFLSFTIPIIGAIIGAVWKFYLQ